MSKCHKPKPTSHAAPSSHAGSALSPLKPASCGGGKHPSDLDPGLLHGIAKDLGMPLFMVFDVLESDPAILETLQQLKGTPAGASGAAQPRPEAPPDAGGGTPAGGNGPSQATLDARAQQTKGPDVIEYVEPQPLAQQVQQASQEQTQSNAKPPAQTTAQVINYVTPQARLFVPETRPPFAQIPGSQFVRSPTGFTFELAQYDIRIYNPDGRQITRIWGDPHVNEGQDGDNWHFGNDSSFILRDGTKMSLDTREVRDKVWLVEGVDIMVGNDRFHFGTGDEDGMHKDGIQWDKDHADAALDDSAGVFAMADDGTWAMRAPDGNFYDVQDESWNQYLSTGDVTFDTSKQVKVTDSQRHSALHDTLPGFVNGPENGVWEDSPDDPENFPQMVLKKPKQRPSFVKHPDSDLVQTPLGYTIEMKGNEVYIWDLQGKPVTRIWGDPHVEESKTGETWHFGQNSSFILPDGTKIALTTKQTSSGFWFVKGVDVLLGTSRYHYGDGGKDGMANDGRDWDRDHADRANSDDAGVFALTPGGEWAIMGKDGHFYDVQSESWSDYKKDPDVDLDPDKRVKITLQQNFAASADFLPEGMMMPAIGEAHESTVPATQNEKRANMAALLKVMPPWHINLIEKHEPDILPALASDLVLAKFVGDMPVATLKHLLKHAPHLIINPGKGRAPKGALWPVAGVIGRKPKKGGSKKPDPWWAGPEGR